SGACLSVVSDPMNCGKCANVCPTPANGAAKCDKKRCTVACNPGYTNCDGSCVSLSSDGTHCGACDKKCGALEVCASGSCALLCGVGTTNCGSSCVDTRSDT